MKLNWNFLGEVGGGTKQNTFHGGSMDNFWNCTLHPLFVLATLGSVFEGKKAKILSQQEKQKNICG